MALMRRTRPPTPRAALLIVRNAFDHDARVLRAARTFKELGFDTTVLAVVSWKERREEEDRDGIAVRRIAPRSRLSWALFRAMTTGRPSRGAGAGRGAVPGPGAERRPPSEGPVRTLVRRLLRYGATLNFYRRGIAFVRETRPEVVQCNDYNTMWIGIAARYMVGSTVIYDSHELWPDRNLRPEPRWWLLACEALFVRAAHHVVVASPGFAGVIARRYRVREPAVVRNIPERPPRPQTQGAGERRRNGTDPVAVYGGGLLRNRGLEQVIRALPGVDRVRLRLIGPVLPDYLAELEALAESVSVRDRIDFAGAVPPGEVIDAVADGDVGLALFQPICLSYRLGFPNKLSEYVLAGIPILGSDVPTIGGFIRELGVGMTVDPEDVDAIATRLGEILSPDRNEAYRRAAREAARELDWEREREVLKSVYREAVA